MTMTLDPPHTAPQSSTITADVDGRRGDDECQASAGAFLRELIGAAPEHLVWDGNHHLQGHAHCGGRELVLIASRDASHRPVVMTVEDWDTIRHSFGCDRAQLLRSSSIESRGRLLEVLAA
jgi:hypothetical protein